MTFIATFCHKIINNEELTVSDNDVELIYVQNLCEQIVDIIKEKGSNPSYDINS